MAHPAEYYLKFVLAQGWGKDDSEPVETMTTINKMLAVLSIPPMTEEQYDDLKVGFQPPKGFMFNNARHRETAEFMQAEKIYSLWRPTKEDQRVLVEIVDGYRLIKQDIHLMLMGNVPHNIIASKLNTKYRLSPSFNDKMISFYSHYYWNVGITSAEEWDEILSGRMLKNSYMAALFCGEQQALYRAGFSPKVDSSRAMKEAYRQAYFRLEALRFEPDSKLAIDSYSKLTARLLGVHDVLYSGGTGLQDQLKEFRQIMMMHKDPDVRALDRIIDKVKGGGYSGDGTSDDGDGDEGEEETNDE